MNWKRKRDEAEVEQAVRDGLPEHATAQDVMAFGRASGLDCSGPDEEGVIACRAPARSGMPLVGAEWIIELYLEHEQLSRVTARKVFTGP